MPNIEEWLRLYSSENLQIRLRAANGILERGEDAPLDTLIDILRNLSWHGLGAKTEKALLKRHDPELVPKMIGLLKSDDDFVREVSCTVLGHSGDRVATPHLLRMIDDPKMMVRRAAGFALAFLKDKTALSDLRQLKDRHSDDDTNVVMAIDSALRSLASDTESPIVIPPVKVGLDFISLYRSRVQERLSTSEGGFSPGSAARRTVELLFFPSFHPETIIQVTQPTFGTLLRFGTMNSSIWYYEQESAMRGSKSTPTIVEQPILLEEVSSITQSAASSFWNEIDDLNPEGIVSSHNVGIDGITVRASYKSFSAKNQFEAWGPSPESPQGKFVKVLFDLAWSVLKNEQSLERLEQLHGYLRSELPYRWIDGEVKCLRIFGRLSSPDEKSLRSLFGSLRHNEPLVIDMTNFEGMGTLLYPVFIEVALGNPRLAWAASTAAMHHLKEMGIAEPGIFQTVKEARRSLTGG